MSDVDLNLVSEVVQVAMKEIVNRFDLKTANASIELDVETKKLTVRASDEFKVEQVYDVLIGRMAKRGLALKRVKKGKVEQALSDARLEVTIESGIPTDKAKKIQQAFKDAKLKVNAQIQDGRCACRASPRTSCRAR